MKVAVVRNRSNKGIIGMLGRSCPETYGRRSVQNIIDGLREGGHEVGIFEGDMTLLSHLKEFIPLDSATRMPLGVVFNLAYGIQGDCRYTHVPSMLEMCGIPYTGAGPLGQTLSLDKVITKILLEDAGVPTPDFLVTRKLNPDLKNLEFPLVVKPRHESTSYGLNLVHNYKELNQAIQLVLNDFQQEAMVEEYVEGREVSVCLMGNDQQTVLPTVEIDFQDRSLHTLTWEDKYHKTTDEPEKKCPADVDSTIDLNLKKFSLIAFRACHCRDYAKVDIRIDPHGNPYILEINSMPSLGPGATYTFAARTSGMDMTTMACKILNAACERYFRPSLFSQKAE
jgi:D-alanine-D-alanine ligase